MQVFCEKSQPISFYLMICVRKNGEGKPIFFSRFFVILTCLGPVRWQMVLFFTMPECYWFLLSWLQSKNEVLRDSCIRNEFKFQSTFARAENCERKKLFLAAEGKIPHMIYCFPLFVSFLVSSVDNVTDTYYRTEAAEHTLKANL